MSDFKARLVDEYSELNNRVNLLSRFMLSEGYKNLNVLDQEDLLEQHNHMNAYLSVLVRRVSRICECI